MKWYLITIITLGVLFLIYILIGFIAQRMIFRSRRHYFKEYQIPRFLRKSLIKFEYLKGMDLFYINEAKREYLRIPLINHQIACAIHYQNESDTLVLLLHGYQSRKEDLTFLARHYHEKKGFDVLAMDHLGHGETSGLQVNFGHKDSLIVEKWIKLMKKKNPNYKIIIHGLSMGAFITLKLAQENFDNVVGVIADSPFYHLTELFYTLMPKLLRWPAIPLIWIISFWNKVFQGFYIRDIKLEQLDQIKIPVLIFHGSADKFIDPEISSNIYDKLDTKKKRVIIENAHHVCGYIQDNELYVNEIELFIEELGEIHAL